MTDGEVIAVRPEIEIIYLKQEVTLLKKLLSEMESNNKLLKEKVYCLECKNHDNTPTYASALAANLTAPLKGLTSHPIEQTASRNREHITTCNKQTDRVVGSNVKHAPKQSDQHRSGERERTTADSHHDNTKRAVLHNKDPVQDTVDDTGFQIITHQKAPYHNQLNRGGVDGPSTKPEDTSADSLTVHHSPAQERKLGGTRRHRHKPTIATGNQGKNIALRAADRKVWIHLSRFNKNTNCDEILKYLKEEFPNQENFSCEQLTTLGDYASFKVGASYSLLESLNNPALWPAGIAINRFFQKRRILEINP